MPTNSWWAESLNPKGLSQGDLAGSVLVGTAYEPATFLGRDTWTPKGRSVHWPQRKALEPFRTDSTGLYIARGKSARVLVVSHSCELDKKEDSRVLVALTAPISVVQDAAKRASILAQQRRAFIPLPDVPEIGDCYADLRTISYVERKVLPDSLREFSMTDDAVVRLRAQLIEYFTRMPVTEEMKRSIADDLAKER